MRRRPITNVPASVHARLLNVARDQGTQLNFLLQSYAAERFLYRMGQSPAFDRFTLKGATLFVVWGADTFRGTRDVDLLRSGFPGHEALRRDLEMIGDVPCPEDGVEFERGEAGIRLRPLPLERTQGAVRVRMNARLGTIRLPLQVDVGFGDLPVPEREKCTCPVLLDQPEPTVWTYRRETHVAEKFHAMVRLGRDNSRMKDLWDIAALADRFSFDGPALRDAISHTFGIRGTSLADGAPTVLEPSFYSGVELERLWSGFLTNALLFGDGPVVLSDVGARIRSFLEPIRASIVRGEPFRRHWPPGGPWRPLTGARGSSGSNE